jgi:hypothetical protein
MNHSVSIIESLFNKAIQENRLSHSYLFYGVNKDELLDSAHTLIKNFLTCHHNSINTSETLPDHPDIYQLDAESSIKLEHIKLIQDHIKFGPYNLKKLFVIIPNIDTATPQAANAFLKTLEEPIENVIFFLTSPNIQAVIKTIQSRSICIYTPTEAVIKKEDHYRDYNSFKALSVIDQLQFFNDLSSNKPLLIDQLYNWLIEIQQSPHPASLIKETQSMLKLIESLQFNVNVRLQCENFTLSLA